MARRTTRKGGRKADTADDLTAEDANVEESKVVETTETGEDEDQEEQDEEEESAEAEAAEGTVKEEKQNANREGSEDNGTEEKTMEVDEPELESEGNLKDDNEEGDDNKEPKASGALPDESQSESQIDEDKDGSGDGATAQPLDVDPIYEQTLLKPLFERRDKSLKELLDSMEDFSPIIPDAVSDYYLTKSGFKSSDIRIKRLLALATQKFIADIANDAYQYSKIRSQSGNASGGVGRGRVGPGSNSGRTVLTMESLNGVLEDYGINAKRPEFFR